MFRGALALVLCAGALLLTSATAQARACNPPVPALRPSVCIPHRTSVPLRQPSGPQGVDVSAYQGAVHWSQARRAGLRFAYVQYGDGTSYRDPLFRTNVAELRALRIPWGAYLFLRPGNGTTQGRALGLAERAQLGEHALPPAIDAEVPGAYEEVCAAIRAVRAADGWGDVVVYTAPGLWPVGFSSCTLSLWVADYGTLFPSLPWGWGSYVLWQYEEGRFIGVSGAVDRDLAHGILSLSYGRTVELPRVEAQRATLRAQRLRQHCAQALRGVRRYRSEVATCKRELAQGSQLTTRAAQLAAS